MSVEEEETMLLHLCVISILLHSVQRNRELVRGS